MIAKLFSSSKTQAHPSGFRISDSLVGKVYIANAQVDAWKKSSHTTRYAWLIYTGLALAGHALLVALNQESLGLDLYLLVFYSIVFLSLLNPKSLDLFAKKNFLGWLLLSIVSSIVHMLSINYSIYKTGEIELNSGSAFLLSTLISVFSIPGPVMQVVSIAIVSILGSLFVGRYSHFSVKFSLFIATAALSGIVWKKIFLAIVNAASRSSLAMRITMAPAYTASVDLESNLDPERFLISSRLSSIVVLKWSGSALANSEIKPAEYDQILTSFNAMIDRILLEEIPNGAWFADVIQQEVHVYFFSEDSMQSPSLNAFKFANKLLQERSKNSELNLLGPIDIGIATGHATSGIIGPQSYQKTTAIGALNLVAINAKLIGEKIREFFSGPDRILMTSSVAAEVSESKEMMSLSSQDLFLKHQWRESAIYIYEPSSPQS